MLNLKALLSLAMLFVAATGCTSISFQGMYNLVQLKPLEINPHQIRVAIKANRDISVKTGDVKISLSYVAEDNSVNIDETFFVEVKVNAPITADLFENKKSNENITLLALTEKDANRFKEVQQIILTRNEKDLKGKGGFGLGIENFCLLNTIPKNEMTIDMYVQTSVEDGYFNFLSDFDLISIDEMNQNKQTNSSIMCS